MRYLVTAIIVSVSLGIAGCVSVDLGQASKDWSEVGKSFAESYKEGKAKSDPSTGQEQQPQSQ